MGNIGAGNGDPSGHVLQHRNKSLAVGFTCSSPTKHAGIIARPGQSSTNLAPQYILPPPQRGCAHAITTVAASNIAGPCGLSFCPLHADHISVRRDAQPLAATTPINPATCPTSIPKGQASLMSPPPTPARTSPSTRYSPGHHSPLQLATASESTADGRVNQSGNRRCRISHQDKVAAHKP